jgi:hypothetical protein
VGTPAYAHNALTSSDPSDGATLEQGPGEVRLTFLATIDPDHADLSVTGPDGRSATEGEPEFDGSSVTVPVRTIWAGDYEIGYEVMSTDGHLVDGSVGFTVTVGQEPAPTSPSPTSPPAAAVPTPAVPTPAAAGAGQAGPPGWWPWLVLLGLVAVGAGGLLVARRGRAGGGLTG